MVFAAVIVVSLYNGLNTNAWTGWVFFAVFLGIVLLLLYTVLLIALHTALNNSRCSCSLYTMLSAQAGL